MCAIGRADFDQFRARLAHDVGNPKRASDLDELPARDDDFASRCQRAEHQQYGRRIIVDHRRGFGARQLAQQRFDDRVTLSAASRFEIVFQVDRSAHGLQHRADGFLRENRPTEIGVQHCARQIEDGAQSHPGRRIELCLEGQAQRCVQQR